MTQGNEFQPPHPREWLAILIMCLAYIVLMMSLNSCTTTKYVTVPVTHTDTVRLTHLQRDSIWLHDSIYQHEFLRGDTVYQLKERWHTQYRDRLVRDTTYISRRDTVSVPYPVEKRVPATLSWHQQLRLWLGNLVLVALAICAVVWLFRHRQWWLSLLQRIIK